MSVTRKVAVILEADVVGYLAPSPNCYHSERTIASDIAL
jgi:hypothetical protein